MPHRKRCLYLAASMVFVVAPLFTVSDSPSRHAEKIADQLQPMLVTAQHRSSAELREEITRLVGEQIDLRIGVVSESKSLYAFEGSSGQSECLPARGMRYDQDIWVINKSGTGLRRVTHNGQGRQPVFSQSGQELAFVSGGSISILNVETGESRTVLEAQLSSRRSALDYHYEYIEYSLPTWSPNGRAIAAAAQSNFLSWVVLAAPDGSKSCSFARGFEHYAWNAESELILDYGKFVPDWQAVFPPFEERQNEAPAVEEEESLLNRLTHQLAGAGVVEITHCSCSPVEPLVVIAGRLKDKRISISPGVDLWLANKNGTIVKRLTNDGWADNPVWSPREHKIAYESHGLVKILDLRTSESRYTDIQAVYSSGDYDSFRGIKTLGPPDGDEWAPDGRALALESKNDEKYWLTVIETQSGSTIFETSSSTSRSWYPDAKLVVIDYGTLFLDWSKPIASRIMPSRATERVLSRLLENTTRFGVVRMREFFFSPSHLQIVGVGEYETAWGFSYQVARPETDLWLADPDGNAARRLTTDRVSYEPAWSPFGDEIAFVSRGTVKIIPLNSGRARVLQALRGGGAFRSECDYVEFSDPRWAPNAKAISSFGGNGCGEIGILVVNAQTGREVLRIEPPEGAIEWYDWTADNSLLFRNCIAVSIPLLR